MNKLLEVLKTGGMIDCKYLSDAQILGDYRDSLDEFLGVAEKRFGEILGLEEVDFGNCVYSYLTMDEELGLLYGFLHHLNSVQNSEVTREIVQYFQPKYVEFGTRTGLSKELYLKFKEVEKKGGLDEQQTRSLELLIRDMERAGVHLEGDKKERLKEINQRLAELSDKFSNNVIDSRGKFFHHFENDESLGEVPEQDMHTARIEAEKRDLEGWVFTLSPPSMMAVMKYCDDRDVRKKFYERSVQIATEEGNDNRGLVVEILKLRGEKAGVLGHGNFAEYVLTDRMAEDVESVEKVLHQFVERALVKGKKDVRELEEFAGLAPLGGVQGAGGIQGWDFSFWSDKLKKEKFSIDEKELKKYFPLEKVVAGMFEVAGRLYGVEFKEVDVPSYHEDVVNYEVYRDGELISYFFLDLFARDEKRPGAWCNTLRGRHKKGGEYVVPIVLNVSNFGKSNSDKPTLLSHYEVTTMFHEFGHALHMMLSRNDYSNTGSMSVEWDFVELPSQLMENWCWEKEALDLWAGHYESGEKVPGEVVGTLKESRKYMSGYGMVRQNQFGLMDLELHDGRQFEGVESLDEFCLEHARRYALLEVPEYYKMYASFGHIFAGGYAAGYYSYLWAEILEAEVFQKFLKMGILNEEVGREFAGKILEAGTVRPGIELFREFMGKEPSAEALMEKLGI